MHLSGLHVTRALPEPLQCFIRRFNDGAYFQSHEVLEAAWLQNRSAFYRGLIIYAAAFVKRDEGNCRGLERNLRKALRYLRPYAPCYLGIDVSALVDHAEMCLCALAGVSQAAGPPLATIVPAVRLVPDPDLITGREAELDAGQLPSL
jgi:uncharacterized protein